MGFGEELSWSYCQAEDHPLVSPLSKPSVKISCGSRMSLSVAVLSPGLRSVTPAGTVTVAVLSRVGPLAPGSTVAVALYRTEVPGGRWAESSMSPVPADVQLPPPDPLRSS